MPSPRSALPFALLLTATAAHAAPETELADLLKVLPGHYAGMAPKAFKPDGTMERLVHSFTPITAPQFGQTVFYYQISKEGRIQQAKIFVFDTSPARPANTMRAFILDTATLTKPLSDDPARIKALDPASLMTFPSTCDFTWTRTETGFEGKSGPDCAYPSRAFNQTITPSMTYRIHPDRFEMSETLTGEDGRAIVSTGGLLTASRQ
ncbi:MAG: hypothetical protein ACMVO5_02290 [Polymorphobacter sp.]|uniref:hypothetical protein n=1 Tax=Polymorphobacter sp. TaxID=1909290 RepID=UPI003A8C2817